MFKDKYIEKTIDEICNIISEDRLLTNEYIDKNKGEYPVYSATLGSPFGYVNSFKQTEETLCVVNYGNSGQTYIVPKGRYNIGRNICGLRVKNEYKSSILLEYVKIIATPIFIRVANGEKQKSLSQKVIKNVSIKIPILESGKFDIEEQRKIIKKEELLSSKKAILLEDKKRLEQTSIDIDLSKYTFKNMKVKEIFDLTQSTNSSKFTKSFIQNNWGDIPVYGATKIDGEVGYGYVCDNAEIKEIKNGKTVITKVRYFEDCLTYNIDGSAGYIFYRKGKFSLSEKVRPLIVHSEFKEELDLTYLKYMIQPIFRANVRGRKGPNGQNEFTKISRTVIKDLLIPIPIKEDGLFDLISQQEIAAKYGKIEQVKNSLCNQIENVLKIGLDL